MCSGNGNIRVSNKEMIQTVNGSVNFTANSYKINPGLSSTFNWLSSIASAYEFYKIHSISIHYVPLVGSQTPGYVAVAFDSDVLDDAPNSKIAMSTYAKFESVTTWKDMSFKVPQSFMNKFV